VGFDFLGFTVSQYPCGKTTGGHAALGDGRLTWKTCITPNKSAVNRHVTRLGALIRQ
jgi:RNA-directed DNA polymerase